MLRTASFAIRTASFAIRTASFAMAESLTSDQLLLLALLAVKNSAVGEGVWPVCGAKGVVSQPSSIC